MKKEQPAVLEILHLEREGFQQTLKVGDLVEHEGREYVVIRLGKLWTSWYTTSSLYKVETVCQRVGTYGLPGMEKKNWEVEFKMERAKPGERQQEMVGRFKRLKDGSIAYIHTMLDVHYEFTDLIGRCQAVEILPWTKAEMREAEAGSKTRFGRFRVIEGNEKKEEVQ